MHVAGDPSLGAGRSRRASAATCRAGGAGAVNHWYDRDIDAQMARTATRPVPAGRIAPRAALSFGIALGGAVVRRALADRQRRWRRRWRFAASSATSFVYTVWLKRRTPQNIVIGGAAGAVPPLVGWAAVDGLAVAGTAVYLFAIVFFWTPPHFWALSLLMKDEYAKVGVPMLPVVRGEDETRRQILLYTVLLYAVTQLPFCAGGFGAIYLVASLVLGAAFIAGAVRAAAPRRPPRRAARCTSSRWPTWRCCSPRWSPTPSSRSGGSGPWTATSPARTSAPA